MDSREIKIGRFTIREGGYAQSPDKIEIMTDDGEASDFSVEMFEKCVNKFYEENF